MAAKDGFARNLRLFSPDVDGPGAALRQDQAAPIWEQVDNENLRKLPNHLKQFIVDQQYDKYTPIDHAVWRYVMRQNYSFLKDRAHESYVEGLRKTGIGIEKIPSVYEMNDILDRIGWACVTVDGFIPPAAFMEYQAFKVLVIAADMRQINHIEYTPAPDIIHEAAGHAPIIADPTYAEYLRRIGEIGAKAMSSRKDFELYEAIRHLSILKETPDADPKEVAAAERLVEERQANLGKPSEMALLSRLHWWTVEYGLIGTVDNPKIYGAGLLSSIGESANCMTERVRKLPYDLDTQHYAFDITTQQPQLFVTSSFQHLIDVLEAFADGMAFRVGGMSGLTKAIECRNVCTAEYNSGLQVSGVFSEALTVDGVQPVYIRTTGPTALAWRDKQLAGHGKEYHADGFGAPVGRLKGHPKPLEDMTDLELAALGARVGDRISLEFDSGVRVAGILERADRHDGRLLLLVFRDCTVTYGEKTLFEPAWGTYDMAVGDTIRSVYCNAADKDAYEQIALVPTERTVKVQYDARTRALQKVYQAVRDYRESGSTDETIVDFWRRLRDEFAHDWLASLEILEVLTSRSLFPDEASAIRSTLVKKAATESHLAKLIRDGLRLVDNPIKKV